MRLPSENSRSALCPPASRNRWAHKPDALAHGERLQIQVLVDPIFKIGHTFNDLCQFRLTKDDDLQELFRVRLEVQQFAQHFQRRRTELLPLIYKKDKIPVLLQRLIENPILNDADALPARHALGRPLPGEQLAQVPHEFIGILEPRVQQQKDVDAALLVQAPQQTAAQRALSRAHLAENHVQAPPQPDGDFQPVQAVLVRRRSVIRVRVRRVRKRAPASDSGAPNSCSFGNTLKKTALEEKGKRSSRERERTGLPVFPGLHPSALFQLPDGLTETPLVLCVDEGRLGRDDALHKQAFDVVVHRLHPNIAIGL